MCLCVCGCRSLPVSAHLCTHKILTNSFVTLPKTLSQLSGQNKDDYRPWTTPSRQSTVCWPDLVGRAADVPATSLPPNRHPHTMHTKVSLLVGECVSIYVCVQKIRLQLHTQHTNYSVKAKKRAKLFVDEVKSGQGGGRTLN